MQRYCTLPLSNKELHANGIFSCVTANVSRSSVHTCKEIVDIQLVLQGIITAGQVRF